MEKYWALDYTDERTCELVYNDQLYLTKAAARAAAKATGHPERFDVTPYRMVDLMDVYQADALEIDEDTLRVKGIYKD
jgi:hypothetical protein